MRIRNLLTGVALAGALSLGAMGCWQSPEYHFKGEIDGEQVHFYEPNNGNNYLDVTKEDGSLIEYCAIHEDFKLNYIYITIGENRTKYSTDSNNEAVKPIMEQAQKEFDEYLTKILEIQTAPLYDK
ncbi:MAG: hypothetical protein ABIF40_01830 [archaeon]